MSLDRLNDSQAIANAYYVEAEFDVPRLEGKVQPTLYLGPPRQLVR